MENQKLPIPMLVGKMMHDIMHALKNKSFTEEIDSKLTMEQIGLLFAISQKEEEVIQKDMAEMMGKDKSSILRLIDSLEENELVRRVVDINDRRKNILMVTKKGDRIIKQYIKISSDLMEELIVGLTLSEMNTFYKVVNHITVNTQAL